MALAVLGVLHTCSDAQCRHLQGVLHAGGSDHAFFDVAHTVAAHAVNAQDDHIFLFTSGFDGFVSTGSSGFIDGVHHVDVGVLLQAVFHAGLAFGGITKAVGHADHFRRLRQLIALGI